MYENYYFFFFLFFFFQEDITKLSEIENSLAVFCVATYGEGEPTDNAQAFYDWLQSGDTELNGVNYSVRKYYWLKNNKLITNFCD